MKNRLKGLLALVLSLTMLLSMVVVSYGAGAEYSITANTVTHVANVLNGVATVSGTDGNVTITLTSNVNGRIHFNDNSGNFILDLANFTIDASGENEAICLDNNFSGTVTLIGNGTLKTGTNNIIYKGSRATLQFDVSDGYDYFTLKKDGVDVFANEENTSATSLTGTYFSGTALVLTQGRATIYPVSIGDVPLTSANISNYSGVSYDATNNILTLNNFSYNNTTDGLSATSDLTLNLLGNNTIASTSGGTAINIAGKLTISGTGSLTATGSNNGIHTNNLTIEGGTVNATGSGGYGIYVHESNSNGGDIAISNGTVTATGGKGGIVADDAVTISGGTVNANGTNLTDSVGIHASGRLGGALTISGANTKVTVGCETGLAASTVNILENSTVTINASSTAIDSTTLNMGSSNWYQWKGDDNQLHVSSDGDVHKLDEDKAVATKTLIIEKISTSSGGPGTPQPPIIYYPPTVTPTTPAEGTTVTAAPTFDGGIALSVAMTILTATGSVVLAKKRED